MGVWYATREHVLGVVDIRMSASAATQLDSAIESASRAADALCHRRFYPWTGTRYFDFPDRRRVRSSQLWLGADEVQSVSAVVSGGVTLSASDYFLEPGNLGPPFSRIDLDRSSNASWSAGNTAQRNIAVTGVFGAVDQWLPAAALAEALDSSETGVDVTACPTVGVGSVLKVDSERMVVTGRGWLTSAQTVQTPLAASAADTTVAVTTGSSFSAGETLLVDSERVLVVDVSGNNLTVKRAVDGSVLATHTGSTIYASRTLTVTRGVLGTTSAAHDTAAVVSVLDVPGLVNEFTVAHTIDTIQQRAAGYGRTVGSGDNQREAGGRALRQLGDRLYAAHGRQARGMAV